MTETLINLQERLTRAEKCGSLNIDLHNGEIFPKFYSQCFLSYQGSWMNMGCREIFEQRE